jgi:hypothetical protein
MSDSILIDNSIVVFHENYRKSTTTKRAALGPPFVTFSDKRLIEINSSVFNGSRFTEAVA